MANFRQSSSVAPQAVRKASMQSNVGSLLLPSMVQIVEAAGVPPARWASLRKDGRPDQIQNLRNAAVSAAGLSARSGSGRRSNPAASITTRGPWPAGCREPEPPERPRGTLQVYGRGPASSWRGHGGPAGRSLRYSRGNHEITSPLAACQG